MGLLIKLLPVAVIFGWALFAGCGAAEKITLPGTDSDTNSDEDPDTDSGSPRTSCPEILPADTLGEIESSEIGEASGIAASRKNNGVYWIHNDSGDSPRLFAVNERGEHLGVYNLQDTNAEDWEDMAYGPGPNAAEGYLYIADTGNGSREEVQIYRIAEPWVDENQTPQNVTVSRVERIDLSYPEGEIYDVETLIVDPTTGDIYLVTKTDGAALLFRKSAPHADGQSAVVEEVGTLDLSSYGTDRKATSGDISADGSLIVIRTYSHASIWLRDGGETISSALGSEPCTILELENEPQGEALAMTADGLGFVTVGEGTHEPIYFYGFAD